MIKSKTKVNILIILLSIVLILILINGCKGKGKGCDVKTCRFCNGTSTMLTVRSTSDCKYETINITTRQGYVCYGLSANEENYEQEYKKNCAHDATWIEGPTTCAGKNGSICTENETCPRTWLAASDTNRCCSIPCTSVGGDETKTCSDQFGNKCLENETCPRTWLAASDTDRCCSIPCTSVGGDETKTCSDQFGNKCLENETCPRTWLAASDTDRCCSTTCIIPLTTVCCEKTVDDRFCFETTDSSKCDSSYSIFPGSCPNTDLCSNICCILPEVCMPNTPKIKCIIDEGEVSEQADCSDVADCKGCCNINNEKCDITKKTECEELAAGKNYTFNVNITNFFGCKASCFESESECENKGYKCCPSGKCKEYQMPQYSDSCGPQELCCKECKEYSFCCEKQEIDRCTSAGPFGCQRANDCSYFGEEYKYGYDRCKWVPFKCQGKHYCWADCSWVRAVECPDDQYECLGGNCPTDPCGNNEIQEGEECGEPGLSCPEGKTCVDCICTTLWELKCSGPDDSTSCASHEDKHKNRGCQFRCEDNMVTAEPRMKRQKYEGFFTCGEKSKVVWDCKKAEAEAGCKIEENCPSPDCKYYTGKCVGIYWELFTSEEIQSFEVNAEDYANYDPSYAHCETYDPDDDQEYCEGCGLTWTGGTEQAACCGDDAEETC